MKRLTSILTVAFMAISMTVCAQTAKGGKVLVAYFSASGNTKVAAEKIQKAAGADIYEIQPAKPYTKEDLDYRNRQSRSVVEMGNPAFREKLGGKPVDIKKYDVIYLGFPFGQTRHLASSIPSSSHRTSRARPSSHLPHLAAVLSTTLSTSSSLLIPTSLSRLASA